jgi:hypothetical protein
MLCLNSWYQGEFRKSLEYAEKGLELFEGATKPAGSGMVSVESNVTTLAHRSMALWFLGYPDQSQMEMQNALSLAEAFLQPFLK